MELERFTIAWRKYVTSVIEVGHALECLLHASNAAGGDNAKASSGSSSGSLSLSGSSEAAYTQEASGRGSEPAGSNSNRARVRTKAKTRCSLPPDYALTADQRVLAIEHGIPNAEIDRQFERFCLHHRAKGSVMKDWGLAWQTWARNYLTFGGNRPRWADPKISGNAAALQAFAERGRKS